MTKKTLGIWMEQDDLSRFEEEANSRNVNPSALGYALIKLALSNPSVIDDSLKHGSHERAKVTGVHHVPSELEWAIKEIEAIESDLLDSDAENKKLREMVEQQNKRLEHLEAVVDRMVKLDTEARMAGTHAVDEMKCPYCGYEIPELSTKLKPRKKSSSGTIDVEIVYCPKCGKEVKLTCKGLKNELKSHSSARYRRR
jgi:hypothetical protein